MPISQTISFDNSYAEQMEGFYVAWEGAKVPTPEIIQFNDELAKELGLAVAELNSKEGAEFFAGNEMPQGASPLAQVYAGHQFGGFSPQLGDGRALLVGEVIDQNNIRRDIQLKGSGQTPFSRRGDGKAVVGPVLREYLIGEAMHALGIPTTRALAAVTTGEKILRNGFEPGAVLTRVASSHLRVGSFQFFAARQDTAKVRQLADYAIKRHYNELRNSENKYLDLLKAVMKKQAQLVAKWMSVGFVHGVMNTDNMTISGETIDYGPCAFIDAYKPDAVFSSIDEQGRYAFGNQPNIAQWNLARFAETLIQIIDPNDNDNAIKLASNALNEFPLIYQDYWFNEMRAKIGLADKKDGDLDLINKLYQVMDGQSVDHTKLFRSLAEALRGDEKTLFALFNDATDFKLWFEKWKARLEHNENDLNETATDMDKVNPLYIPRNHIVEEALQAASKNTDYAPFKKLLDVLMKPYEKREGLKEYEEPATKDAGPYVTFCGT